MEDMLKSGTGFDLTIILKMVCIIKTHRYTQPGLLEWHSVECATPKIQVILDWGLRSHSTAGLRSASWSGVWNGTPRGQHSRCWSSQVDCSNFTLYSIIHSGIQVYFQSKLAVFQFIFSFCSKKNKIWNGEWSVKWIEVQKWSAWLHSALQSNN